MIPPLKSIPRRKNCFIRVTWTQPNEKDNYPAARPIQTMSWWRSVHQWQAHVFQDRNRYIIAGNCQFPRSREFKAHPIIYEYKKTGKRSFEWTHAFVRRHCTGGRCSVGRIEDHLMNFCYRAGGNISTGVLQDKIIGSKREGSDFLLWMTACIASTSCFLLRSK